jgi:hypothetical protein
MVGGIISEWRATSFRNHGRHRPESALSAFVANLQGPHARERGIALVSVCVGAMVVARAVDDPALATSFRKAARKHVLASSGWGTQ